MLAAPAQVVPFTHYPESDALLNDLEHYPHAFVIACLMDRQWVAEKAWLVPHRFRQHCGSFEFSELARLSPEQVLSYFAQPEPIHWMVNVMAGTFYAAVQHIGQQYGGNAARIWSDCPSSATVVRRFLEFQGAGPKIATMAANTLVREFKVPLSDKYSIDISVDVQIRRTFTRLGLVREGAADVELIYAARELNPPYPGVIDVPLWEIGRTWCRPRAPRCESCYLQPCCPTACQPLAQGAC